MNPLDLDGPDFLVFYGIVAAFLLLLAERLTKRDGAGDAPRLGFDDPYLIAYLRGGKYEALRVATVALIDRGLLDVDGDEVRAKGKDARRLASQPVEKAIVERFERPAASTFESLSDALIGACEHYERKLVGLGLLPDSTTSEKRNSRFVLVAGLLVGLAAMKIGVALERGRDDVLFLVVGSLLAAYLAYEVTHRPRTGRGDALVADLRTMLASLLERSATMQPGGANGEAALLAAVFGLDALPEDRFPYVKKLYPKAASSQSGGGWYSGSSCSSGCGSSCGGGCGGGCGGCGG